MENHFVKPEFILEKFYFKENFKIPHIKDLNAKGVIDVYEGMRDFFPSYQYNDQGTVVAPKLENILNKFDALLLDAFGVLNVGPSIVPGIIETIDRARDKNILEVQDEEQHSDVQFVGDGLQRRRDLYQPRQGPPAAPQERECFGGQL